MKTRTAVGIYGKMVVLKLNWENKSFILVENHLDNKGYSKVRFAWDFFNPKRFSDLVKWCIENYVDDFYVTDYADYHVAGFTFWFTTKEQAIHFKLACL